MVVYGAPRYAPVSGEADAGSVFRMTWHPEFKYFFSGGPCSSSSSGGKLFSTMFRFHF
jgi:hypothetical protein